MSIELKTISAMRKDAVEIFYQALKAVQPGAAIKRYCKFDGKTLFIGHRSYPLNQYKNLYVLGSGKATASMAAAIENMIDEKITGGIITVKFDHVADLKHINLIEAGHPVPDENGIRGASAILNLAENVEEDDLILCLISGGGSALLPFPMTALPSRTNRISLKYSFPAVPPFTK